METINSSTRTASDLIACSVLTYISKGMNAFLIYRTHVVQKLLNTHSLWNSANVETHSLWNSTKLMSKKKTRHQLTRMKQEQMMDTSGRQEQVDRGFTGIDRFGAS